MSGELDRLRLQLCWMVSTKMKLCEKLHQQGMTMDQVYKQPRVSAMEASINDYNDHINDQQAKIDLRKKFNKAPIGTAEFFTHHK